MNSYPIVRSFLRPTWHWNGQAGQLGISMLGMLSVLLAAYSVFFLCDQQTILSLSHEDGIVESLGAVFFFLAAVLLLSSYRRSHESCRLFFFQTRKNIFLLLLGLAFLFGAAEEISWGQRILGLETPDILKKVNAQQELNFHNLSLFHGFHPDGTQKEGLASLLTLDRTFSLFWLSYCMLVPLLAACSERWAAWLSKINLPLVPVWLGVFFPLNYMLSKAVEGLFSDDVLSHSIQEIKETNCAVLFFFVGLYFWRKHTVRQAGGVA